VLKNNMSAALYRMPCHVGGVILSWVDFVGM
jgi:hypothetical protein